MASTGDSGRLDGMSNNKNNSKNNNMMGRAPSSGHTQRILLRVKGDVEEWKEPLKKFLIGLKEQPGCIRHRWGPWVEDANMLEVLVGWASTQDRETYLASAAHDEAVKVLRPVLAAKPQTYEVRFQPWAPRGAIHSAVIEMTTIHGAEAEGDARLRAQFEQATTMEGNEGASCGYSVEEVEPLDVAMGRAPGGGGGGGGATNGHAVVVPGRAAGKVWVGAAAWTGMDASRDADKDVYIPKCGTKTEIHHVNFRYRIKGWSGDEETIH